MRLKTMQYFIEIACANSISQISRKYGIPQQSLSSAIASLENELDISLFTRSGTKLTLNEAGKQFYRYCVDFFADYDMLKNALHPSSQASVIPMEPIVVAAQNSIAQTMLPDWLSRLLKYHPEIHLEIKIQSYNDIINAVLWDQASIGFVLFFEKNQHMYPVLPEELKFYRLFSCRPVFWINSRNPLAQGKTVTMRTLKDYPLIKNEQADAELFKFVFIDFFKFQGTFVNAVNEQIMFRLVKENLAICPDLETPQGKFGLGYLFENQEDMVAVPLSNKESPQMTVGYITKNDVVPNDSLTYILTYLEGHE